MHDRSCRNNCIHGINDSSLNKLNDLAIASCTGLSALSTKSNNSHKKSDNRQMKSNQRPLAPAIEGDPGVKGGVRKRIFFPEDVEKMKNMDEDEAYVYKMTLVRDGKYTLEEFD